MRKPVLLLGFLLIALNSAWPQWHPQASGTDVQLRGISAVSGRVAWASGAKGTVLRTLDGGEHWTKLSVPGAEALDFRDIQAFDQDTAFVLSIGTGEQSRIYKTSDGGKSWKLQFTNQDSKAFYDCFAFWDSKHGIALSDSVDGKFPLLVTADGESWTPLTPKQMPAALPQEGAFAASGTCIATFGKKDVWFGTGGPAARVFHSGDRGAHWTAAETPLPHSAASQGVFSVLFWNKKDGVAVGGDYQKPEENKAVAAYTGDGGKSWALSSSMPRGYRSGLALEVLNFGPARKRKMIVAAGTTGVDYSQRDGKGWNSQLDKDLTPEREDQPFNAVSCAHEVCWVVGPAGHIVKLVFPVEITVE